MYHGGQLSEDFYDGGNVDFFDFCDKDFMSMLEVDNMVKELGYGSVFMSYQYRIPGMEIRNGLKPLMTDLDVISICKFVPNHTMINMEFIKSFEPVAQSNVVIEELDVMGEKVPDEMVADVGEKEDENDSDFIEEEFPADEDHLQFMKFVDDYVDAHEDGVLAGIKEQNNPQSGKGSRQQREGFEEEIDVDVVGKPDYNSDGLHSVHEDEDGGGNNNECYPELNEKIDMKNPYLSLGLIFRDDAQFRKAVVMHSMINGYEDSFMDIIEAEWNHGYFKMKAYRAMAAAMKIIEGKHVDQYTRLRDFAKEIYKTNPRSACKEGFKHGCRPLIGLDGCHLKSQHGGQLLVVIWFLEILAEDIGIVDQHGWTFINDKQKGLIPAFLVVFPDCHHRFCVHHLYINYREQFKGKALKDALWAVAKTTTIPHFRRAMEELKLLNEDTYDWLMKRPVIHWSRYDLTGIPCNHTIVTINYKREKLEDYVDICYSKVMYLEIYGHLIQPMNRMSMWEVTENPPIQPSLYTRQPGRPKKKINKKAAEMEKEANPRQSEATNRSGDIPRPQQLSRKGQEILKSGICKKKSHNTRTHHRHLPTRQDASSSAHGASGNPGGVPRKRKHCFTLKKRRTRQPRK
ncbi:hypothetical protein D8674_036869 [Pyrus ussuriensis x Pyrus communis]|uniref:PB1-like domain-containing protein n=1 Tax=Pyrus ussuriensis x Pyrus communis TaxID=2448454 RepID=A0A5N5FP49_9ROSA|nr:hypothetical protein D8674_036869 [Pyrus ussuriensis x Pyrus communis]